MKKTSVIVWVILILVSMPLLTGCCQKVTRHASVVGIDKKDICEYKKLHADVWPAVLKDIRQSNIENYSIYLGQTTPDKNYLFFYYEYTGHNHKKDMAKMAKGEEMQRWWKIMPKPAWNFRYMSTKYL